MRALRPLLQRPVEGPASGLEGLADPLEGRLRRPEITDQHHVEAYPQVPKIAPPLQELCGGADDPRALAAIDARRRAAVGPARAHAHLDHDQHLAVARHEVEFARPPPVILLQDLEPMGAKMQSGQPLGLDAGGAPRPRRSAVSSRRR